MLQKSRKESAFTRVKFFSLTATVFVIIAVTVAATVTCPPAFLGYCRNSELRLLFTMRVLFTSVAGADE